jgi:SEC-C motif-containing protein
MRSRFAAFALGRGAYLVATLAMTHPDLALPRDALVRDLSGARERQRFLGLAILHTATTPPTGEVLFYARVFERGADRSFAELSQFVQESGAWKYASGVMLPRASMPAPPESITREAFLRAANGT